jgi:exodeoxyribonuclease VIII
MSQLNGFVSGMPFEEYAQVDALSGSELLRMRRSPMFYRWCEDNPQEPTDDMKLGTVIHTAILEPPLLGKIAVWGTKPEEKVRNGKVWDAFKAANSNLLILTKKENEQVVATVEGAYENPNARKYLDAEGECELSMFWVDAATGLNMKGRLDKFIRTKETATVVDLKKTRSPSARRFGAQAFQLGYYIKAAIYVSGVQALTGIRPKFKWIAIESKGPHESAVYRATPDVLTLGMQEWETLARLLIECRKTDVWPQEQEVEEDLILPEYAFGMADELDDFAEVEQ